MAQFRERDICNKHLCENKIYSTRDHSLAMQALKKKIIIEGVANFETDPRYVKLMQCKKTSDQTYYDVQTCKAMVAQPSVFQAPQYRPQAPPPQYRPQPQPQPRPFDPRTWGAPPKQRPVKPCPIGKIRNPKTGRCINDPALKATKKATKKASPAKTQKACPDGKIRNSKTGRCINDPALKATKGTAHTKTQKALKPCPEGKIRNPSTNRCINDPALKAKK